MANELRSPFGDARLPNCHPLPGDRLGYRAIGSSARFCFTKPIPASMWQPETVGSAALALDPLSINGGQPPYGLGFA